MKSGTNVGMHPLPSYLCKSRDKARGLPLSDQPYGRLMQSNELVVHLKTIGNDCSRYVTPATRVMSVMNAALVGGHANMRFPPCSSKVMVKARMA